MCLRVLLKLKLKRTLIAYFQSAVQRRTAYSQNDLSVFREECRDLIHSNQPITKEELKRRFSENPRLALLLKKYGFNSLKIKMRTERNKAN